MKDAQKELLIKIKMSVLELDPYELVKAELDSFWPSLYLDYPSQIKYDIENLCSELEECFYLWEQDEYIASLQAYGAVGAIKKLKEKIYDNIH